MFKISVPPRTTQPLDVLGRETLSREIGCVETVVGSERLGRRDRRCARRAVRGLRSERASRTHAWPGRPDLFAFFYGPWREAAKERGRDRQQEVQEAGGGQGSPDPYVPIGILQTCRAPTSQSKNLTSVGGSTRTFYCNEVNSPHPGKTKYPNKY